MRFPTVEVRLPEWVAAQIAPPHAATEEDRMRFVAGLARENVLQNTGGPFAAAVFASDSGALVSVGLNLVLSLNSSVLHAEVVAILLAQQAVQSYTLGAAGAARHELVTSCEPCAMCLGAVLWSGVRRLVCGAGREDAAGIGFDEGPVFPESYAYLERRGIDVVRGVERDDARAVLLLYAERNGVIYNG